MSLASSCNFLRLASTRTFLMCSLYEAIASLSAAASTNVRKAILASGGVVKSDLTTSGRAAFDTGEDIVHIALQRSASSFETRPSHLVQVGGADIAGHCGLTTMVQGAVVGHGVIDRGDLIMPQCWGASIGHIAL
eukprot:CAMPEP_0180813028 /NCGR_PEP_ID=MMETSP1038_2-20121128/66325_1 /TAXON_ID=632150 /ORGANISM="Azadinium spinosum, Strain 3D9" /LENGTH=134 /DNA_ID=CAMNT_0022854609 /DNA_START=195 /DNA_END=598 /DNA_ORIENTATION=+